MPRTLIAPLAWLLICLQLALVTLAQAGPAVTFLPATAPGFDKGILWQVESANGKSSYLFGTIHVDDPRITDLHPSIRKAIAHSRSMTLELIPDPQTLQASMSRMFFSDGQTLQQVIGAPLYKQAVSVARRQICDTFTPDLRHQFSPNLRPI
ncbi:TraB/GumN family protein, partial [Sulfuriflexus sp.]|uniref:TraB/GumN family protein n=1 Tax=Sulfuriflexus sp. TaxID=2015443 RepID=UPI0028CFABF4